MGITERKARNKKEMRTRILDTAMELFLAEGFGNVSMRRIADKIEYSPATTYLYFKDKDEILYALHRAGFEELHKRQQEVLRIKDPLKRLRKHGDVYIKFAFENPEYYNLMFIMRSPARKMQQGEEWAGRRSYEFFKQDVQCAVEKGVVPKGNVEVVTLGIWSIAHGIVSLMLRNRCPMIDEKELPKIAMNTFDYFIKNLGVAA